LLLRSWSFVVGAKKSWSHGWAKLTQPWGHRLPAIRPVLLGILFFPTMRS
jgi:hypothetical protein